MAKQSSLFNFFTKSPPSVSKPKPSPSPTEADLPSLVEKSNSSPKEEAKQAQQQRSNKTSKVNQKSSSKTTNNGFKKLFGDKTPKTEDRSVLASVSLLESRFHYLHSCYRQLAERIR